jgi:hypothetical protein
MSAPRARPREPDGMEREWRSRVQTVLPSRETAATLFWALLASSQITLRNADGWQATGPPIADRVVDLAD